MVSTSVEPRACACVLRHFSRGGLFTNLWAVARQAPLSMALSTKNPGVGCHAFLQGIFPTQGSNPGFLYCRQIVYHLNHQGNG